MKIHWMDACTLLLLGIAVGEALLLQPSVHSNFFALLQPRDPPQMLQGPGALDSAIQLRLGTVGQVVTIEDLVRGSLALQEGKLTGVKPLTASEREELGVLVQRADGHRKELLRVEAELSESEQQLAAVALQVAATLTPEQREKVRERRDQVSVGEIEKAYWDALLQAIPADVAAVHAAEKASVPPDDRLGTGGLPGPARPSGDHPPNPGPPDRQPVPPPTNPPR